MITKCVTTNIKSNNLSFKSSFVKNDTLESYIKAAGNSELLSFYSTLDVLANDGRDTIYFINESSFKEKIIYSSFGGYKTKNEITLYKKERDLSPERIESFIVEEASYHVARKNVISEITRILRRRCGLFQTSEFRNSTLTKLAKILK